MSPRKIAGNPPREVILDVLGALNWGGPVRVSGVSVHIHSVPDDGTWREGVVSVETIPTDGHGFHETCPWPAMTDAQAVAEAAELIEYANDRLKVAPDCVASAREVFRLAAEHQEAD